MTNDEIYAGNIYQALEKRPLEFFTEMMLLEVEQFSKGLSENEVLEFYGLTIDTLGELSTRDLKWFYIAFKRGRSLAKITTMNNLFSRQNDNKTGSTACLAYLRHFGDKWPLDSDEAGGTGKFSFNVTMQD